MIFVALLMPALLVLGAVNMLYKLEVLSSNADSRAQENSQDVIAGFVACMKAAAQKPRLLYFSFVVFCGHPVIK